jgi:hypothetical protein
MQLTAQRVAQENLGLRALLKELAVSDLIVEAWLSKDISGDKNHGLSAPLQLRARQLVLTSKQEVDRSEQENPSDYHVAEALLGTALSTGRPDSHTREPSSSTVESSTSNEETHTKTCATSCKEQIPHPRIQTTVSAPCRQLISSATNACAGTKQTRSSSHLGTRTDVGTELDDSDGVECSTAYRTLMQYATSQDKMNRITAALDYGCTPSGTGGCKVKSSVMWEVLDEEC